LKLRVGKAGEKRWKREEEKTLGWTFFDWFNLVGSSTQKGKVKLGKGKKQEKTQSRSEELWRRGRGEGNGRPKLMGEGG